MKIKIGFKSDKALINSLLFSKIFFLFFAEFVYSKLTRLGDTPRYLSAQVDFGLRSLTSSTHMMESTGEIFGIFPFPLYHVPMCLLSWFGLRFLYMRLSGYGMINTYLERLIFFLCFSIPSVGVWSSIHSKESVGVFFCSVVAGVLLDLVQFSKREPTLFNSRTIFVLIVALYLMFIFKPQYCIGVLTFSVYILFSRYIKSSSTFFLLHLGLLFQLVLLYYFQPLVDMYALQMYSHFDTSIAKSTRSNIFLLEWDFYKNITWGMWIAFLGPTLSESYQSITNFMAFLEGCILTVFLLFVILSPLRSVYILRLNVRVLAVILGLIIWLLFVHYPFGIFNPGSAIRYRTNFIPFIVMAFFYIRSTIKYRYSHVC